mmetsp:Transcript_32700/g.97139  ORF Transcript_32700/g.97139 Transcript_32700/m.97139 type:complete len:970 (-) Transcript_32700:127-3036(-)
MAVVVKAVDVVATPALTISEYFGTSSSGDTRLSACIATVSEPCGEAYQEPEFDEYVMIISGSVDMIRGGTRTRISKGEGVLLKAGEQVTWTWPQACQYMIVCLPGEQDAHGAGIDSPNWIESPRQEASPVIDVDAVLAEEEQRHRWKVAEQERVRVEQERQRLEEEERERRARLREQTRLEAEERQRAAAAEWERTRAAEEERQRAEAEEWERQRAEATEQERRRVAECEHKRAMAKALARQTSDEVRERADRDRQRAEEEAAWEQLRAEEEATQRERAEALEETRRQVQRVHEQQRLAQEEAYAAEWAAQQAEKDVSLDLDWPQTEEARSLTRRTSDPKNAAATWKNAAATCTTGSNVPTEDRSEKSENAETATEEESTHSFGGSPAAGNAQSGGHKTPTFNNLPDLIPDETGAMNRAVSLSVFDQLLTVEEINRLRQDNEAKAEADEIDRPARYGARHLSTPIVIVSSEINPWSKTGGLAMVASSYAYEFAVRGHRTMAVAPAYGNYDKVEWVGRTKIWLDGQEHEVNFLHQRQEYGAGKGSDFVFVDHACYKRPQGIYGDPGKGEYPDNLFRFALLTLAAAEAPLILNLGGSTYGQEVMFIANDWQTGLLPVYLKYKYKRHNTYMKARCMYVLHNMGYQGKYRKGKFPLDKFLGLPQEAENDLQGEDTNMGHDCHNLLAAGIRIADRVLTVSPNYAKEIQTPEGGQGLHPDLRNRAGNGCLSGILNGISDEWTPSMDPHIAMNYNLATLDEGKAANKAALQREVGIHQDPGACLIGFCGRLCYQKGVHLIAEITPWLMADTGNGVTGRVQIILMGKGEPKYEEQLRHIEGNHRGRICSYVGFSAEVEHRMMAGCDLLLMPSQYEPCGLPQMYAQMYGTLPVVHETGGLKDSVIGLWDEVADAEVATGFLFSGLDANKLKERLYQAMNIFHHKKHIFVQMQYNAMQADYYWPQAIDEYEKHIDQVLG